MSLADSIYYSVPLPSWSWMGWRTGLQLPNYVRETQHSVFQSPEPLSWSARWYGLGIDGKIIELDIPTEGNRRNPGLGAYRNHIPQWSEGSQEVEVTAADGDFQDSGHIIAWTSYARLRIRTQRLDYQTRLSQFDFTLPYFNIYSNESEDKFIGRLRIVDILDQEPTVLGLSEDDWYEDVVRYFDLIVLARSDPIVKQGLGLGSVPVREATLYLMQIEWDSSEPNVASRIGLFTVPEGIWMKARTEWKRVVLK
jgi:hypothetical protein